MANRYQEVPNQEKASGRQEGGQENPNQGRAIHNDGRQTLPKVVGWADVEEMHREGSKRSNEVDT